jgi:hypothetical protein
MDTKNEKTDRTIITVSIFGSIVSLVGLIMAIILDQLDQKQMLIPIYTLTMDDLPKPQPLVAGLDSTDP